MMKKIIILLISLLLLTAVACSEPFEPKLSGSLVGLYSASENTIADMKEKGITGLDDHTLLDALTAQDGYDITSSSIRADAEAEIYKFASNNLTVLSVNGDYFMLGDANGGYGVVSTLLHDLDGDGINEIYFTYCTGEANKGRVGCYVQATASVLICETEFDTPLLAVATARGGLDLYAATVDYGKFAEDHINAQVNANEKISSLKLNEGMLTCE